MKQSWGLNGALREEKNNVGYDSKKLNQLESQLPVIIACIVLRLTFSLAINNLIKIFSLIALLFFVSFKFHPSFPHFLDMVIRPSIPFLIL